MSALTVQMEAYAFRQLAAHLQWRSDVQNIDLMNLAGFCRNCLSKWYLAGAQVYGVPMDYSEACERVYGEPYPEWKKRHQKRASEEQLSLFESLKHQHARTDPGPALAPPLGGGPAAVTSDVSAGGAAGHSNVCGQGCDADLPAAIPAGDGAAAVARVAVLTASDRASAGAYADESGPAVVASMKAFSERNPALATDIVQQRVVADDEDAIFAALQEWSSGGRCNLIFTTGGTGLGPRDVTPEATRRILARPAEGLARAMAWQTSFLEPHSVLSRGACGVTATGVLVVNLPGHPAAVKQCLAVLLPVLPRALQMLGH